MTVRISCPHCRAALRLRDDKLGRPVTCPNPECGREFVANEQERSGEPPAFSSGSEIRRAKTVGRKPVPLARPVAAPLAKPVVEAPSDAFRPARCPRCGKAISGQVKVCAACGTNLETGRRTIRAAKWDQAAERKTLRESWLGWASIWLPLNVVPYASEVPLRRRPTALLVIMLLVFLCFPLLFSETAIRTFALWGGGRGEPAAQASADAEKQEADVPRAPAHAGRFHWYQLVTYQFLHGDTWHLAFNLALLLVVAPKVNDLLGNAGFVAAYLILGAAGGLSHLYSTSGGPPVPLIGASGSVMAMAGMYAVFCPQHRIRMVAWARLFMLTPPFFLVFRVRGLWLLMTLVALDLIPIFLQSETNVAHGVHFISFLCGAVVAGFLLVLQLVNCGGYDLWTWCFGQEFISREEAVSRSASDIWTRLMTHPVLMAGVMLIWGVSLLMMIVRTAA